MSDKGRIYFYGTLPKKGEPPFGGGEVGNLRTVTTLSQNGYDVRIVRHGKASSGQSKAFRHLTYPFRFLAGVGKWFFLLLFGNRKSIAHVSGFYGSTMPLDVTLVDIASFLGYKTVYELRGGGATEFYNSGDNKYKRRFKRAVSKACCVFSQGLENKPLLDSICSTPFFYYPNSVNASFYPESLPEKPLDKINVIFFGRIEPAKHPLLSVEAISLLQKDFRDLHFTLIGRGEESYVNLVKKAMNEKLSPGSFEYVPGCDHDSLKSYLERMHFLIFPSAQKREGQSNAITEAMSFGVIPIATPQGFTRSVVGFPELIVENLGAESFASAISSIIKSGKIPYYSGECYTRFKENYTEETVSASMLNKYDELFRDRQSIR